MTLIDINLVKAKQIMNKKDFKTSIGGQALLEGIMMKSPLKGCMAVRKPNGEIFTEEWELTSKKIAKVPFVRGVFVMVSTLKTGYSCLMKSADISMTEEEAEAEKGRFEKYISEKFGAKAEQLVGVIASVLGVALAIILFMLLPTYLTVGVNYFLPLGAFSAVVEGLFKLIIFVGYLALVSRLPDIKRTFGYHGAEHKTIFCYEAGESLTVENIRKFSRFHPRCGTSFLLIVIIISILINSMLSWGSPIIRVIYKLLLLPIIIGISYEIIKLAGKYDNPITRFISAPGLALQNLTTYEPDDEMIEIAIAAVKPVLPEDKKDAQW